MLRNILDDPLYDRAREILKICSESVFGSMDEENNEVVFVDAVDKPTESKEEGFEMVDT
jgi:hypothetical protein